MRVLLDAEPCSTDTSSLGAAIAGAAAAAEARGRVVVEVVVDGTAWSEHQLATGDLGGDASEVRLASADLGQLVRGTLADAAAALDDADAGQRAAAEHLHAGDTVASMEALGRAIEIWMAVQEAVVKSAAAVNADVSSLVLDHGTVAEAIDQLGRHLRVLREALVAQDPVAAADTLMYELPDTVIRWRSVLAALDARAAALPVSE